MGKGKSSYKVSYSRVGNFSIAEVLGATVQEPRFKLKRRLSKVEYKVYISHIFDGHSVKMDSLRYQTFKAKGVVCVDCGLEATHFGLEAFPSDARKDVTEYHFNLYGIKNGKEVMMTKDHIFPKSRGGKDLIENMQPMCTACNCNKGSKIVY